MIKQARRNSEVPSGSFKTLGHVSSPTPQNYNSQRPPAAPQQTRGRRQLGEKEADVKRSQAVRGLPHIRADPQELLEDVFEPGSGAHRQEAGQNGPQEEHGKRNAASERGNVLEARTVCGFSSAFTLCAASVPHRLCLREVVWQ